MKSEYKKKLTYLIAATTITTQIFSVGIVFADSSIQNNTETISSVKTIESYPNTIVLKGGMYGTPQGGTFQGFSINFDTNSMKLKTSIVFSNNAMHPGLGNKEYARIELYSKNGDLKKTFSIKGNDKVDKVNSELNDVSFSYGDRIKIYHAEPGHRVNIIGKVRNGNSNYSSSINSNILNNYLFEIRTYGLRQIKRPNILNNQIILSGKKYQSRLQGFRMRFNMDTHKIIVDNIGVSNAKINSKFKGKDYIKVDQIREGKIINSVSLRGDDKVEEALHLQDMTLNFGDQLRVYHAEAGSKFKVTGNIGNASQSDMQNGVTSNTITFELTNNGLTEVNHNN